MSLNILIIDDEEPLRKLLSRLVTLENYTVQEAGTLKAGAAILHRIAIDILLCDVKLPDGNGVEFVGQIKQQYPHIECILLTAYGNIPDGVQAIKNGALDYIVKGNDNDRIIPLLSQASARISSAKKTTVSVKEKASYSFDSIIGNSPGIQEAIRLSRKIAGSDANVLLLGETGTGKEVFANAIHEASRRSGQPFVAINCSAFTRDLLEGELFGHKAGAYTGAIKDKKGLIELANKGILFLDEIGEMNLELQAKLLRVLENGEFVKLGDEKTTRVDIRIIAATNRDLEHEIANGHFREDLFYRLNGFTIKLPALRDRAEDIPHLAQHFLQKYAKKESAPVLPLHKDALVLLQKHRWRGNIRELKNVLDRAAILAEGPEIGAGDLPYEIQQEDRDVSSGLSLANIEKQHIQKVLAHTKGNKTKTAELLGIGLTTLYRKIEEYKIN